MSQEESINKYLSKDGQLRASVVIATNVVEEVRLTLGSAPMPTIKLGRVMMGCLLMAGHLKEGENVGIYYKGSGPMGVFFAEANHEGTTRGYAGDPLYHDPNLDYSKAVGIGLFEVVRTSRYYHQTFMGAVEIKTGETANDLAYYLFQSHQVPSVVALSVSVDESGRVIAAAGVLIELMPGASEETIKKVEEKVKTARNLSEMVQGGSTKREMINEYLSEFELVQLEYNVPVKFECRCSEDKAKRTLLLLGVKELEEMINDKEEEVKINCDFCNKEYHVSKEELKELKNTAYRSTLN